MISLTGHVQNTGREQTVAVGGWGKRQTGGLGTDHQQVWGLLRGQQKCIGTKQR